MLKDQHEWDLMLQFLKNSEQVSMTFFSFPIKSTPDPKLEENLLPQSNPASCSALYFPPR